MKKSINERRIIKVAAESDTIQIIKKIMSITIGINDRTNKSVSFFTP